MLFVKELCELHLSLLSPPLLTVTRWLSLLFPCTCCGYLHRFYLCFLLKIQVCGKDYCRFNWCYAVVNNMCAMLYNDVYSETGCFKYCRQLKYRFPNWKLFTDNSKAFVLHTSLLVIGNLAHECNTHCTGNCEDGQPYEREVLNLEFICRHSFLQELSSKLRSYSHLPTLELCDGICLPLSITLRHMTPGNQAENMYEVFKM
jgi:hypothetical protein